MKKNISTTSKKNTGGLTIKAKKQNLQSLSELYHAHRGKVSDKWNSYLGMYDKWFDEVRQKHVSIYEIGVQNGGSLEIWRKYFHNAKFIVGCDINEKCKDLRFRNKTISVIVGDANSDTIEQHVLNTCPAFDIIIDDGSHKSSDIVRSFSRYFKYLNHDGFYIIEDLHCSYWEEFEGGLHAPYSAMAFFKQLVDILNYEHWGLHTGRIDLIQPILEQYGCFIDQVLLKQIHTIEFSNSLCLIRKAKNPNSLKERIVVGEEQSIFPNRHLAGTHLTSPSEVNNRWTVTGLPPQVQFFQQKPQAQQDRTQLQEQIANLIQNNKKTQEINAMAMRTALLRISNNMHEQRTWRDKGWSWLRARINPEKAKLITLRASVFFDADWYLATYPDVAEGDMDPARHYLNFGAEEGRDPGPFFSTLGYYNSNPSVGEKGVNPLLHFEGFGWFWRNSNSASVLEILSDADRRAIQAHIDVLPRKPLISVVMPVYNTTERFLREAIESVIAQSYPHWELCIANDASPNAEVVQILNEFGASDKRIKIVHRETNGNISAATNSALELANGEFVALLDHDDLLDETALYEVAVEINSHPDADIIYSDEDRIDENGKRSNAYYKTDFNPELLLGQNMINHLGVYRRSLIEKIGGLRLGFEGSQDYDLALRIWNVSSADRIRHIPAILYHWRYSASPMSFSETQLEKCVRAARQAIQEFLDIEGEGAKAIAAPDQGNYSRVVRKVPEPLPLVSVIVPTKDRADLLSVCAHGILNNTDYSNVELLIVDHDSQEEKTLTLFEKLESDPRVRVLPFKGAFNYSTMNNMAAAEAKGSVLALVNNDIEVIEPDWLTEMVSHVVRPEVGAVGAKLLYVDGRIQHAGVILGLGGVAGHAFHLLRKGHPSYFSHAVLARAISAVTGACLIVRKQVFFEVNGLNEHNLAVAFNDVDLCLKIQAKGYRNVWTPFAQLVHHESLSRGAEDTLAKKARFRLESNYMTAQWKKLLERDPYYNPNLTLNSSNYGVAKPSRRPKPWAHMVT